MSKILIVAFGFLLFAFSANATEIKETSENGVKAWYVQDNSLPIISIKIAFKNAGYAHDPKGKEGLAYFVSGMLNEGAGQYSSEQFQKLLEENAIAFSPNVSADEFFVSIKTMSANLPLALELLNTSLTQASLGQKEVDRVKSQILGFLEKREEDPKELAAISFYKSYFAGHPYSNPQEGELETVKTISPADLRSFTGSAFAKDNLVIAVSGDVDEDKVEAIISGITKNLPKHAEVHSLPAFAGYPNANQVAVKIPNPQTVIYFGLPGISRDNPQFYAAYLLNQILGGDGFGAKLMTEVREKRGLAYYIGMDLATLDKANIWMGTSATQSAKASETISLVKAEIAKLQKTGVTEEELAAAKKYVVGALPLALDTNDKLAGFVLAMQLEKMGRDYLETRAEKLNSVTLDEIKNASMQLADPNKLFFVTVGQ